MMTFDFKLPDDIQGWSAKNKDIYFTRETIFDYMNGAGEVYLSYDFKKLLVREYIKESAPGIVVEIYQRSSSEDAYGIFTHDNENVYHKNCSTQVKSTFNSSIGEFNSPMKESAILLL